MPAVVRATARQALPVLLLTWWAVPVAATGARGHLRWSTRATPRRAVKAQDAPFSCCDEAVKYPDGEPSPARFFPPRTGPATFALERVGLAGSGLLTGEVGQEDAACMTATPKEDGVGGFGLHLQTCESTLKTIGKRAPNNTNPQLRESQEFLLSPTGQIRSRGGLCVRRVRCGRLFLYDLGNCDGPGYVAIFTVRKPVANNMDDLKVLGFPAQAVAREQCLTCGPYLLLERCLAKGGSLPRNGAACGENYQAEPGFSKMPSTYVGDAAAQGRQPDIDAVDSIGDRLYPGDAKQERQDMAGLAGTAFDGICGSYTTDGPSLDSVFYIHKVEA